MSVGLILAAGQSQRLGQPKQLLTPEGQTLLGRTIDHLSEAGIEQVVVVLGAYAKRIEAVLLEEGYDDVELVHNAQWSRGQATSLALGLRHVADLPANHRHVVIALSDQPLVTESHYRNLTEALSDEAIDVAATRYPSGGGVPAAIRRSRWQELQVALAGDQGAKPWIRVQAPASVQLVEAPLAEIDIDTKADLERLTRQISSVDT